MFDLLQLQIVNFVHCRCAALQMCAVREIVHSEVLARVALSQSAWSRPSVSIQRKASKGKLSISKIRNYKSIDSHASLWNYSGESALNRGVWLGQKWEMNDEKLKIKKQIRCSFELMSQVLQDSVSKKNSRKLFSIRSESPGKVRWRGVSEEARTPKYWARTGHFSPT